MAIVVTPTYPAAGSAVDLSLSAATGNVPVFELVSVPGTSELDTGLLLTVTSGVDLSGVAGAQTAAEKRCNATSFTPDVAGEYVVNGYDFREVIGFSSFSGDTAGGARFELVGFQTGTVHAGQILDLPVKTASGHGGTVRVQVNDSTVRAASIVDTTSDVARVAATQSTVTASLDALVGVTVSALGEDIIARTRDLRSNFELHRVTLSGVHYSAAGVADTTNQMQYEIPLSIDAAIECLIEVRQRLLKHMVAESSGGVWHQNDDTLNLPSVNVGATLAEATVMFADVSERMYERHRVLDRDTPTSTQVHANPDNTHAMPAPLPLTLAIVAFLDAIETQNVNAPAGESEGATDLAHQFGFKPVG